MLSAKNQQGESVDWWFIYKTPKQSGNHSNQGFDFFYYDHNSSFLALSPFGLDEKRSALGYTLGDVFKSSPDCGYISYNDEHANAEKNKSEKGHCKGVLAFNKRKNSALLLLHSTPRFPTKNELSLPEREAIFGQTYLCITLPDYHTAERIAEQMLRQQNPQVLTESSYLPPDINSEESLSLLFHGGNIEESRQPQTLSFTSKAGKRFLFIAKSRKWGKDFWIDLVSPQLKADLVVETWRRGAVTPLRDTQSTSFDEDALTLKFNVNSYLSYEWPYTKDHSKWAVSLKNSGNILPWVCVGDMNRMVSQEKRGGGCLCFQEENLWQALMHAEERLHKPASTSVSHS
ncbi:MAG: deoxyribonuclease II family protein [Neptuniibacter sp.]